MHRRQFSGFEGVSVSKGCRLKRATIGVSHSKRAGKHSPRPANSKSTRWPLDPLLLSPFRNNNPSSPSTRFISLHRKTTFDFIHEDSKLIRFPRVPFLFCDISFRKFRSIFNRKGKGRRQIRSGASSSRIYSVIFKIK